ncbi:MULTISPECIES: hypothetical protein [unclassified Streptomyces]|uniref:hypothetical protein n=1 Tax=unclassified Streptomyces TaxID=2593676 RepID=UPI002E2DE549|nr:hypothetical protein [Streptomyces sp. NBC_00223]
MKTRERSAAGGGGGRQSVPAPALGAPVGGERLPTAPRERKPALAALAVLLILVGALGATVMVLRAGNKISVVEVTTQIAAGQPIPQSALREVMVSDDTGLEFITWGQRGDLTSHYRAATNLTPGSLLVVTMVTPKENVLAEGKSLIGLSLKSGQLPHGLANGDTVAAYLVGNEANKAVNSGGDSTGTSVPNTLISGHLVVKDISSGSEGGMSSGDTTVTVVADSADAGALTAASASGQVALVLVSGKN